MTYQRLEDDPRFKYSHALESYESVFGRRLSREELRDLVASLPTIPTLVAALKQALTAQERIAKLSGLDTERIEHSVDEATLERLRADAIAASETELEKYGDPIRYLYGLES